VGETGRWRGVVISEGLRDPGSAFGGRRRLAVAGVSLVVAGGLAVGGCASSQSTANTASCSSGPAAGGTPSAASASSNPAVAAGWALPGGNLQNTRDVASAIDSANVSELGVAWCVPLTAAAPAFGNYAATPVVVDGVVYAQDLQSNVMAISVATGKVLWTHDYNSPNGGPDGVNVVNGTVYASTDDAAVALNAANGSQLWSRTLVRNDHEGIDSTPGYDHGTVYVSTVPVNASTGVEYGGGGQAVLWALNAATGVPEWSWDEVQNLWGNPGVNSGGGLWYPPSFDAQGNIYIGVANPGPLGGVPGYPWGTSRPGPNLYTDSVVKLSPAGKLLWYYQLTPHDLFDWDLQDPPLLTTANGQPVVIDGGKAGILVELNAQTGKPIWRLPVGVHNGNDHDGLLTENASPGSPLALPAQVTIEPGAFGGIETQLATNGSTTFAAVNDLPFVFKSESGPYFPSVQALDSALDSATGEMVAVNQDTGKIEWDTKLPSSPYGAATVTNNVVFTTTYSGDVYALNAATGAILRKIPLSAGTNAPVTIDGNYVITGAGIANSSSQQPLIIAYRLGAKGRLPDTVGS
jgi:alcohol dehydrogenase (cytochrome c)